MGDVETPRKPRAGGIFAVRYILCSMLFLSSFLVYAMRLNLSVSIVAMVNEASSGADIPSHNESCRATVAPRNETISDSGPPGEFDWDQNEQAMIIYAFFVGYLISQIPGGFLAEHYSATRVLGLGVGVTGFFTCLTAIAARHSLYTLIVLRVLEGLGEGVIFPAMFTFVSYWIPLQEQTSLLNFVLAGSVVGAVVTMPASALLCRSYLGWPASFYVFGVLGLVWTAVWLLIATDSPEQHLWLSAEEREFILEHRPPLKRDPTKPVPWKQLLLSPAVLLLGFTNFGGSLNGYIMLTEIPSYLNSIYGIRIDDNGWISGGLSLGLAISMIGAGIIVDNLITQRGFSRNVVRKLFVALSTLIPSGCLCIVAVIGCNYEIVLAILLMNCAFIGLAGGGGTTISMDLAPKYAGTVLGIVNLIQNTAGVIAPLLVGQMTNHNNTLARWNLVFVLTAAITAVSSITFLIYGSTNEQSWNSDEPDENTLLLASPVEYRNKRR